MTYLSYIISKNNKNFILEAGLPVHKSQIQHPGTLSFLESINPSK